MTTRLYLRPAPKDSWWERLVFRLTGRWPAGVVERRIAEDERRNQAVRKGWSSSVLTWPCRVCGDVRPDELIAVAKKVVWIESEAEKIPMTMTLTYCADREACGQAAVAWQANLSPSFEL